MSKISAYAALGGAAPDDLLPVVDVHDTSMAASGTTKKMTLSQLPGVRPWQFRPEDYGAKGDGKVIADAVINGTTTLTSASAAFTSADTGKSIMVNGGGGTAAVPLITTITYVSATTVTLAASATASATGCAAIYGTDDTAAVNSAVSAASTYAQANQWYAEVVFGPYNYCLASGPAQTAAAGAVAQQNAQIPLPYPAVSGSTRKLVIALAGAHRDPSTIRFWESSTPELQGTCLVSMVVATGQPDATYGSQSVIGGPTASTGLTGGFAQMKAIIDGITVVCGWNTQQIGFDFRFLCGAYVAHGGYTAFSSMLGNAPKMSAIPANGQSAGIWMPLTANNDDCSVDHFSAQCVYYGIIFSEHFNAQKLSTIQTNTALLANITSGQHGASIAYAACEQQTYALAATNISGGYHFPVFIGLLDVELTATADIYDPRNNFHGVVYWDRYDTTAPQVNGAANLKIVNCRQVIGPVTAPGIPATTVSLQNTFWKDATVYITSGGGAVTVIAVDGTATGLTLGTSGSVTVRVPSGHTITLTYAAAAPTWAWVLE
jgi:hypothetical protein